jgi:protein-L-isoaspartate(D-aspartate) O-methyltransferase
VTISAADAAQGKRGAGAPFSLIVIDGAVEQIPDALAAQLSDDGRIVSGLVLRQVTRLAAGQKIDGRVSLRAIEDLGIPVLHAFDAPKGWSFA